MGDNAKKTWEWHNVEVGKGFQSRGVVRQPQVQHKADKIIDLRGPISTVELPAATESEPAARRKRSADYSSSDHDSDSRNGSDNEDSESKHKKSKKHKSPPEPKGNRKKSSKSSKRRSSEPSRTASVTQRRRFNPLLQLLASRLSDTTQSFTT